MTKHTELRRRRLHTQLKTAGSCDDYLRWAYHHFLKRSWNAEMRIKLMLAMPDWIRRNTKKNNRVIKLKPSATVKNLQSRFNQKILSHLRSGCWRWSSGLQLESFHKLESRSRSKIHSKNLDQSCIGLAETIFGSISIRNWTKIEKLWQGRRNPKLNIRQDIWVQNYPSVNFS